MKLKLINIIILLFFTGISVYGQETKPNDIDTAKINSANKCLECHANHYYTFVNKSSGENVKKFLSKEYIIDRTQYKNSEHGSFACTDCHVPEFETYPHVTEAKLELKYTCIDCHGGDEKYAKFHFDDIEVEVDSSIHKKMFGNQFKCVACHNPHTYKLCFRKEHDIGKIIKNNNKMCLACHNDIMKYQLYTDSVNPNLEEVHNWLPNQKLHFKKVRCIECHTLQNDSIFAHRILPKEKAVKNCVECHSKNSTLLNTLYRFNNADSKKTGDVYLIGANNNKFIEILSVLLFSITFLIIFIHIILRIKNKRTK